jgi:phospholipase A-2-activating protein
MAGMRERFIKVLFKAANWMAPWTMPLPKYRETNVLLLLRTVANMFQDGTPIGEGTWVGDVGFHFLLSAFVPSSSWGFTE